MTGKKKEDGFDKLIGGYNSIASAEFHKASSDIARLLFDYYTVLKESGFNHVEAMTLTTQFQEHMLTMGMK